MQIYKYLKKIYKYIEGLGFYIINLQWLLYLFNEFIKNLGSFNKIDEFIKNKGIIWKFQENRA